MFTFINSGNFLSTITKTTIYLELSFFIEEQLQTLLKKFDS